MDANQLKQAGFSDAEIGEYAKLQSAGFSDTEIQQHYAANQTPSKWKTAGPQPTTFTDTLIRGGLELGGMTAGAVLATPSGPAGIVAGGALGYAGGKTIADKREEMQGKKQQPDTLTRIGDTGKAVVEGAIMEMGGQVIGKGVQKAGKWLSGKAAGLYESALKIPPSVPKDIRDQAVKTGIEGKYTPNEKQLARLQTDIESTNRQIATAIDNLGKAGKKVDTAEVLKRVDQLKDFYKNAPDPTPYLKQLDEIKDGVLKFRGKSIPTDEAQKIKQTIYQLNKKHYGEMKGLDIEANKAIARGLKEEIFKQNPTIGELNAKDSALINLEEVLERAVKRIRNYDVVRLGDTIAAGVGAASGGPVGAVATGMAKRVMESPEVKARIAFAISKTGRQTKTKRIPAYVAGKAMMTQND